MSALRLSRRAGLGQRAEKSHQRVRHPARYNVRQTMNQSIASDRRPQGGAASRRDFLRRSTAVMAGGLTAGVSVARGPQRPIRAAVAGDRPADSRRGRAGSHQVRLIGAWATWKTSARQEIRPHVGRSGDIASRQALLPVFPAIRESAYPMRKAVSRRRGARGRPSGSLLEGCPRTPQVGAPSAAPGESSCSAIAEPSDRGEGIHSGPQKPCPSIMACETPFIEG